MPKPFGFKKPFILSVVISIFLALLLYVSYNGIPFYPSDGYKRLPQTFNDETYLIKYVMPNKKHTYWAFCRNADSDTVIYSFGKKPKYSTLKPPSFLSELFVGCLPGMCSKYIVYADSGKVHYIESINDFKTFLGTIDNLQEAVLLVKATEKLHIDDDMTGGAYTINADTIYNLRMMRYNTCPESKQSIYLKVEKNKGITDTSTFSTYYQGKGCIINVY